MRDCRGVSRPDEAVERGEEADGICEWQILGPDHGEEDGHTAEGEEETSCCAGDGG